MLCKNCGKELPAESSFCPYCMTKFTEETPVEPISSEKSFIKKPLIISVAVCLIIALAVSGVFVAQKFSKNKTPDNLRVTEITTVSEEEKTSEKVEFSVDDTGMGFSLLQTNLNDSDFEDTEKLLLDYFDDNYFTVSYDSLVANPKSYKNARVHFTGTVKEVIEKNENNCKVIIEYGTEQGFDGISYYTGNLAVISCESADFEIFPELMFRFFGVFNGLDTISLFGEKIDVPEFDVSTVKNYNMLDTAKYSMDEILPVAEYIFGKGTILRKSSNDDFEFLADDYFEDISDDYFVSELLHLENEDFQKFAFYNNQGGYLIDCKTEVDVNRYLTVSSDFEHYYVVTADFNTNSITFECYNKSFEKMWSRIFTESPYFAVDYTEERIYLSIGEKLYILDAKTGEDATDPKLVGEKISVIKLTDGILLISPYTQNAIVKTDLEGNELWKITSGIEAYTSYVQIIDNNYVIQKVNFDEYGLPMEVITTVVSPKGKIVSNTSEY